jgi:hypothetical protein
MPGVHPNGGYRRFIPFTHYHFVFIAWPGARFSVSENGCEIEVS